MKPYLWQLLLFTIAGWINRVQQDAIEYLKEENRVHGRPRAEGGVQCRDRLGGMLRYYHREAA